MFAMELNALEVQEAIRALERVMGMPAIKPATRVSLRFAIDALRDEQG